MHDTAKLIGQLFFTTYFEHPPPAILEIGSMDLNGSLRDCAPPIANYTGVDLSPGPGVDLVLEDPYVFPFDNERFDAIVSSSCFEHDPMFWLTFIEVVRVAKTGGFIYINAPSNGKYHTYPLDNWRFYPDAALSLVQWSKRCGHQIELIESFIAERSRDDWNDCVMVFRKGQDGAAVARRIVDHFPAARNVRRGSDRAIENLTELTDDLLLLGEARALMTAKDETLARLTADEVEGARDAKSEGAEDFLFGPTLFQRVYLRKADAEYGPTVDEVVDLLVEAGLGLERYCGPYPPVLWERCAAAANNLLAWMKQNPQAPALAKAARARVALAIVRTAQI